MMRSNGRSKIMVSKNVKAVVEELELAYMSDKVDMSALNAHYSPYPYSMDAAIWALAEVEDRALTLHEVFNKLDDSVVDTEFDYAPSDSDRPMLMALESLYKVWADFDAIIAREDNILRWSNDSSNWKIGYQKSLAELIVSQGSIVDLVPSVYGWVDYDLDYQHRGQKVADKAVAVFNVKEDYWREFNGTFNTDDDSRSGMIADVLYSTGLSRKVRYEGSLGEIMKEL